MSLRSEMKKEERASDKRTVWGGLLFGIIFLLLGIYLELNSDHLQPFITQASSRHSSAVHDVLVEPKSSAKVCFALSFIAFLFSYGSFRKIKMEKNNPHFKN
jgi:hypothetical protein